MLITLLIAAYASLGFFGFVVWSQRKEIVRLNRIVTDLVEANNRLYGQKKNKDIQIKRLCHGNPELN